MNGLAQPVPLRRFIFVAGSPEGGGFLRGFGFRLVPMCIEQRPGLFGNF